MCQKKCGWWKGAATAGEGEHFKTGVQIKTEYPIQTAQMLPFAIALYENTRKLKNHEAFYPSKMK